MGVLLGVQGVHGEGAVSTAAIERDEEEASVLFFSSGLERSLEETQREAGKSLKKGEEWRVGVGAGEWEWGGRKKASEWLLLGWGRDGSGLGLDAGQQAAASTAAASPSWGAGTALRIAAGRESREMCWAGQCVSAHPAPPCQGHAHVLNTDQMLPLYPSNLPNFQKTA